MRGKEKKKEKKGLEQSCPMQSVVKWKCDEMEEGVASGSS